MLDAFLILIGSAVGALSLLLPYLRTRRENSKMDEERQLLAQEKAIVVDFMHHLVEAIGEGLGRQELFQRVVRAATLSTGAVSACVYERNEKGKLQGVAVEGLFPPQRRLPDEEDEKPATRAKFLENVLRSETLGLGEGLVGEVASTGKPIMVSDATRDPRIVRHDDPSLEVRSAIYAPIKFGDLLIGVLAVVNPSNGLAFGETDFSLVNSLAEQAALAIHNSDIMHVGIEKNKLDMDLALASNVQSLFLPAAFPSSDELEVDARYLSSQQVGGDFYDFFRLGPSRFGMAIADVSGKGVPASLLMAIGQTTLRHLAKGGESPAKALMLLNRELNERMREDMFITAIYGIIDLKKNTFTFARAGHELPLIIRPGKGKAKSLAEYMESEGLALGMVPDELFDEVIADCVTPFNHGDSIVLFTDGVTEAADAADEQFSTA
ncbi:MAG: GAF domain-containing SpoIIE family protein phosphatase, partial [Opitutales bacterium]